MNRSLLKKYNTEDYQYEKIIGVRKSTGELKLKRLKGVHRQMIGYHLRGMSNRDIAFVTGFSEIAISRVLRDPLAQAYIQEYLAGTENELASLMPMAVDALRDGLGPKVDPRTRLQAADKYFRATGRYAGGDASKETAEDVIKRALEIAQTNSDTVREITRAGQTARVIDGAFKQVEDNSEGE